MADSMQSQINQLATLSQLQQRFVSDVSHELRTPLTTIRLAGDVIYDQRGSFPPATSRTAELLHTQIERFDRLLSDLLEISRYDAGSVALDPEPTNLVRLAEEVVDELRTLSEQNGSELRLEAPGGYFDVGMDPRRIRRVVRNLIGNAIEHGEGAPVVVTVDSNETAVALAVRDYGIGMNQQDVNHVFDRFWRADPSRKRTLGGTGLGLAISLEDATLHSGWLQVWSMPAQGSCFRLTLPRFTGKGIIASPLPLPPVDAGTKPVPPESSEPDDTGALDRVAPALGSAPLPGSEARA
jgi:two-component system sensor histidine kinase MtrB